MSFSRLLRLLSAALLAALFAGAAWARFRLPLTPLADPDIWCYVHPGLSRILGGPFQHTYGQCFLYPGLIYVVLATCGDWRMITAVQHGFGLGTGALLLVAWRQVRGFLPRPRLPRFLFDVAGLAMAGVYLFSLSPLRFEHTLRPEAVFPFFAVLSICANLAFIRHRFCAGPDRRARAPGPDRRGLITGAGAVFAGVMALLLKPGFSAMLLLGNVPVGLSLFLLGSSRRDKLALALVSVLAPGLLLLWPEQHFRRGDPDAHSFLATSLFTVHAGLIRDQMADDVARHRTAPYDPAWLGQVQARLTQEIRDSTGTKKYPLLGHDPDYLKREDSFHGWLVERMHSRERVADFYDDYYRRAWRGRPLAMADKIWRGLRTFYRPGDCPAYLRYDRFDLRDGYAESATIFDPGGPWFDRLHPTPESALAEVNRYAPGRAYIARCEALAGRSQVLTNAPWAAVAAGRLAPTYLPLVGWALLLGAAAGALPGVRRWAGPIPAVLLLLYAYNFGTTLALSIGHTMEVDRYSTYQLAYTLLPQSVSAWLAVEAALTVGAVVLGRCGPWFAARPVPLPGLAVPTGRELTLGLLLPHVGSEAEHTFREERFRQAFPAARWEPWDTADATERDVWLDAAPVETARRLLRAYADAPADLITLSRARGTGPLAGFVRWAVGADPGTPGAGGGRLLSGRLRRSLREAAAEPEWAVWAAGRGFSSREIPAEEESVPPTDAGTDARERWRRAARLGAVCCRCRPLRVLGTAAGICLLLAAGIGASSLHHPPHARHRWVARRGAAVVAGGWSVAAVFCLTTGGVLEVRRRRWRAAFGRDYPAARCVATPA